MAIPRGSGTEVLKRLTENSLNATTKTFTTVPAHHIWTLLSLTIGSNYNGVSRYGIIVNDGSDDCIIVQDNATMGAYETFVFSDRLILTAGDILKVYFQQNNCSLWFSYIDQDWS